jgi:hypothetical protein
VDETDVGVGGKTHANIPPVGNAHRHAFIEGKQGAPGQEAVPERRRVRFD